MFYICFFYARAFDLIQSICSSGFLVSGELSPLTFGSLQFVSCAFTPAWRMDVRGIGIHPEVVAVRVAIEMEPQTVTTDLDEVINTLDHVCQTGGRGHIHPAAHKYPAQEIE